jgi:hypothetical protein
MIVMYDKHYHLKKVYCLLIFLYATTTIIAQQLDVDTVFFLANKKGLLGKIGKSISVNNPIANTALNDAQKNSTQFEPFKGRVIRNITIQKLDFNSRINDTTSRKNNLLANLGNALHTKTSAKAISNNLFFREGDQLYPNLLADNEKLLRDLSFLQDAKIIIDLRYDHIDSVDIIIVCKDVFPLGGSMNEGSVDLVSFELNDDNLFGTGNRIQIQQLIDTKRNPNYAFGAEFLKRNIAGSFVNIAMGFQQQQPAFNSNRREERTVFVRGELPLVSPYHRFTGGLDLSINKTDNVYLNDSEYNKLWKYHYYNADLWMGYSLGAKKRLKDNFDSRKRSILAVRLLNRDFVSRPDTVKTTTDSRFDNITGVLFAYTLFEQDFYHTNFIYGFGRNEDIPEGFNLSVNSGWTNREGFLRFYSGFEYQRYYFNRKKNYLNYIIKSGGYIHQNKLEDFSFLTSVDYITRLRKMGSGFWHVRHFLSGSITYQRFARLNDPLKLSSIYGIPRFQNNTTDATGRVTINAETVFYNTWKFFGFSFAPFSFTNLTYLKISGINLLKGEIYTAVGGGIRTRNENLVFGTIELKAYYYPKVANNMNNWNIVISTDLRFRYQTQLIRKPDFTIVN